MRSEGRILLIGQGITTLTALQSLLDRFDVVGLVRSSDSGDAAIRLASASGISLFADTSLAGVTDAIKQVDPDAVVVSSYDRILPADLVATRPFVNVHYAPLPRYRGRATVNWAVINGDSHCAISIHALVPDLDAGGILFQQFVPIGPSDTVTDLYERLNAIQRDSLAGAVARHLDGDEGRSQDESQATYEPPCGDEHAKIDFAKPARAVFNLVRGCDPQPGAHAELDGKRVRLYDAALQASASNAPPGTIVGIEPDAMRIALAGAQLAVKRARVDPSPRKVAPMELSELRVGARLS